MNEDDDHGSGDENDVDDDDNDDDDDDDDVIHCTSSIGVHCQRGRVPSLLTETETLR